MDEGGDDAGAAGGAEDEDVWMGRGMMMGRGGGRGRGRRGDEGGHGGEGAFVGADVVCWGRFVAEDVGGVGDGEVWGGSIVSDGGCR